MGACVCIASRPHNNAAPCVSALHVLQCDDFQLRLCPCGVKCVCVCVCGDTSGGVRVSAARARPTSPPQGRLLSMETGPLAAILLSVFVFVVAIVTGRQWVVFARVLGRDFHLLSQLLRQTHNQRRTHSVNNPRVVRDEMQRVDGRQEGMGLLLKQSWLALGATRGGNGE